MTDATNPITEFTRYYEEHKNSIFNYLLYRISFDRDTAEDLTSEVFIKAFEHFETYDRSRPFKSWIFTIAHNHLINFFTGKKPVLPLDEALETPTKELSIPENLHQQLAVEEVKEVMQKLPQAQQELLIMRYVNDMSNSEIAQILNKEEGAVRTAISRALAALKILYVTNHKSPQES